MLQTYILFSKTSMYVVCMYVACDSVRSADKDKIPFDGWLCFQQDSSKRLVAACFGRAQLSSVAVTSIDRRTDRALIYYCCSGTQELLPVAGAIDDSPRCLGAINPPLPPKRKEYYHAWRNYPRRAAGNQNRSILLHWRGHRHQTSLQASKPAWLLGSL